MSYYYWSLFYNTFLCSWADLLSSGCMWFSVNNMHRGMAWIARNRHGTNNNNNNNKSSHEFVLVKFLFLQISFLDPPPPPPPPPFSSSSSSHLLSATVRVYSLVAPCHLPDLTSLALLGSVSGQPGLSRGPLPGYKRVSKWRLQLQDSIPFLLLSQKLCTTLHTSASLWCFLLFTHMPDCPLAPLGQVWQQ